MYTPKSRRNSEQQFLFFYLALRLRGISSSFYSCNFLCLSGFVDFIVIFNLSILKFYFLSFLFYFGLINRQHIAFYLFNISNFIIIT